MSKTTKAVSAALAVMDQHISALNAHDEEGRPYAAFSACQIKLCRIENLADG